MPTTHRPRTAQRSVALLVAILGLLLSGIAAMPLTASAAGLPVGFADGRFRSSEAPVRSEWLGRAGATGASIVRFNVRWALVAPKKPPAGFEATNPAAAGYEW